MRIQQCVTTLKKLCEALCVLHVLKDTVSRNKVEMGIVLGKGELSPINKERRELIIESTQTGQGVG